MNGLGYMGPSWGYVGLSWPILGLCWPILRAIWAHLRLCWPILGLCWPILDPLRARFGPSWGYVGPSCGLCWPMLTHLRPQESKNGNSKKHRKTQDFLMVRGGGGVRRQGRWPLSSSERRELPYGNATTSSRPRGPLAG